MMTKQFSPEELRKRVDETHPGLGGVFSPPELAKGITSAATPQQIRAGLQANLMKKLAAAKKIIWTQDPKTKKHYGYGRDHIRYVLEHESSRTQYTPYKQLMNEDDFEEYPHEINFWNFTKARKNPPSMDDLLGAYHHDLTTAKELCARDYAALVNPKKLGWLHHVEALYADGTGKNQYMIEEIYPDDLTAAQEANGKFFRLEKSNYGPASKRIKNLSPRGGCTFQEALTLAQKEHAKDLARQTRRSVAKN